MPTFTIQVANKAILAMLMESPSDLLRPMEEMILHFEMWPTTPVSGLITDTTVLPHIIVNCQLHDGTEVPYTKHCSK